MHRSWLGAPRHAAALVLFMVLAGGSGAMAQIPGGMTAAGGPMPGVKTGGSPNIHVVAHIPRDSLYRTADVAIEQELSRPYAYAVARLIPSGFDIITLKDPAKAQIIYSWRIEDAAVHRGAGSLNPIYFKTRGRYYYTNAYQFQQGGPDFDLGATIFDVTGLPDTAKVKEVARIYERAFPGGFHESFGYKHSNGQPLYFTQTSGPHANVYDIDRVVAGGDPTGWLVGRVPIAADPSLTAATGRSAGYHDFYVQYDPANHRDMFYGAGTGGYYVYDVTDIKNPRLVTSATGMAGVDRGHTFMVTPDGRYGVLETEYQYAPVRIIDLKPGLDGQVKNISRPIGAWISQWDAMPHNFAIRWPYVFDADYEGGIQVLNMMDPTNPYAVGYYYTCDCPHPQGAEGAGQRGGQNGAWGIDVRNADGLFVVTDRQTGFWAFKMDGFDGWNGHQWGMPNVSNAQDWDNGPDGAPKAMRTSLR